MLQAELHHQLKGWELEVTLQVAPGRCLALAGPSGAGKTTVLRMLAGTQRVQRGAISNGMRVWMDSATGVRCEPERRRCGYVFQDLALFPHLSAWRNVAFGMRDVPRGRRRTRALELLARLNLEHRADARPSQLSGGERQRVALARALAPAPEALLLDEPLSALDPRMRASAGRELAALVHALDVPVVLVTHDFAEAATLGDEVGVIEAGRIVQRGTASELACTPANAFVADFTGAVVLSGTVTAGETGLTLVKLDGGGLASSTGSGSGRVALSVFPWEIGIAPLDVATRDSLRNRERARIVSLTTLGNRVRVGLEAGQPMAAEITLEAMAELRLEVGSEVWASWKATATRLSPL